MKDFVGVSGVLGSARLRELSVRRNGPALLYLASHWGAIGLTTWGLALTIGSLWCVPLFLLQGLLLNFLYAPMHECDHFTAFESRWLNVWVARICGFIVFNSSAHHRWSHYTHHRFTQNWEKDTELTRPVFKNVADYAFFMTGWTMIKGKVIRIFRHAIFSSDEWYMTNAQRRAVVIAARWHVAGYLLVGLVTILLQSWAAFYYWWGPLLLMGWAYRLQGSAEHTFLTHEPNTLLNTRTLRTNGFMHWVNWNMTYHATHHTFPSVPFYSLPALTEEVESIVGFKLPGDSYLKVHGAALKALASGQTELDICQHNTEQLIARGNLQTQ